MSLISNKNLPIARRIAPDPLRPFSRSPAVDPGTGRRHLPRAYTLAYGPQSPTQNMEAVHASPHQSP
ncbi:hypothetical protein SAMN04488078_104823 [Antarctobacter heliothermus]|uniref:Uncharacterized protein n=1 Tax=Antarctobacter heliothermus TaxID=74033 RepID=A0A239J3X3_9RHOB|nr:hypothetical protein SAMN04488078_104823 [Antarctobacter heliothermus]